VEVAETVEKPGEVDAELHYLVTRWPRGGGREHVNREPLFVNRAPYPMQRLTM
jgi:hypothetical protein